jgi:hypothetical protein
MKSVAIECRSGVAKIIDLMERYGDQPRFGFTFSALTGQKREPNTLVQ